MDSKRHAKIIAKVKARLGNVRKVPTDEDVERILELLAEERSVSDIATELGFSRPTIYKYARKAIE